MPEGARGQVAFMRTLVLGPLAIWFTAMMEAGVHAIERLQTDSRVPPDVVLMDGGTLGMGLIPHIS